MGADWQWPKRMWVIHSWPWYWLVWPWWGRRMYRIVTGVTSDIGMPSTYLVWLDLQIIIFFGFEMISITIKGIVCCCQQHSRGKGGSQNRLLINVNFININCTFSLFFGIYYFLMRRRLCVCCNFTWMVIFELKNLDTWRCPILVQQCCDVIGCHLGHESFAHRLLQ